MSARISSRYAGNQDYLFSLRQLSRHNLPPPSGLEHELDSMSLELTACDDEITRLQAQLTELEALHRQLTALRDTAKSLQSPVRRLPTELLVIIFGHVWTEFTNNGPTDPISPRLFDLLLLAFAPLLTISQVCFAWNTIVMNTPGLWTELHVTCSPWVKNPEAQISATQLLKNGLARSQSLPLCVHIQRQNWGTWEHYRKCGALSMLCATSNRWKTAVLDCPVNDILDSGVRGHIQCLEILELHEDPDAEDETWGGKTLASFQDASRLRRVVISEEVAVSLHELPLEQLEELVYEYDFYEDLVLPLKSLTRLSGSVHFDFGALRSFRRPSLLPSPDLHLSSNVKTFSVGSNNEAKEHLGSPAHYSAIIAELFSSVTLPALTTLRVVFSHYPTHAFPWPGTAFLELAKRSHFDAHLQTLNIREVLITSAELLSALSVLHNLQILIFSDSLIITTESSSPTETILTNELLVSLGQTQSVEGTSSHASRLTHTLVPHLHTFSCFSQLSFDHENFLQFVKSRSSPAEEKPFAVQLSWLPRADGSHPRFERKVESELWQLHHQHQINLSIKQEV
ncbi:F-box domain-containing protein [Mycena indigotica]|uniref:F-box domain-containing protein n=1 Tax=Mycena indigotica TaxID=2126181 RepID=A0A8H6VQN2_9AGAR|nr:F-box domain-containing protein [Mycena indigotica]KAF7290144.1 F-box domain-containing protein [Mycena indigotica]